MEELTERIQELIEQTGLSNKSFAEKVGVSPAIISHITSGRNKPSLNLIQQITNVYTNVNIDYLLSGRGSLYSQQGERHQKSIDTDVKRAESGLNPAIKTYNEGVRAVGVPQGAPIPKRDEEPPPILPNEDLQMLNKRKSDADVRANKEPVKVMLFYADQSVEIYYPNRKKDS